MNENNEIKNEINDEEVNEVVETLEEIIIPDRVKKGTTCGNYNL